MVDELRASSEARRGQQNGQQKRWVLVRIIRISLGCLMNFTIDLSDLSFFLQWPVYEAYQAVESVDLEVTQPFSGGLTRWLILQRLGNSILQRSQTTRNLWCQFSTEVKHYIYIYSECKHCPLMRVPFILQGSCRSVMAGGDSFPTACEEAAVSDSWAAQWPGGFLPYTGPALVSTADWCPPKLPVIWVRNQLTYPGPMVEVRVWSQQKSSGETNALYPHRMALLRTSANVTKKGDGLTLTHDTFQTCSAAFLNPGFFPSKKQPRQTWSDPPWLWCKLRAAGMTWRVRWQMRYVMMRYTEEHVRMAWW